MRISAACLCRQPGGGGRGAVFGNSNYSRPPPCPPPKSAPALPAFTNPRCSNLQTAARRPRQGRWPCWPPAGVQFTAPRSKQSVMALPAPAFARKAAPRAAVQPLAVGAAALHRRGCSFVQRQVFGIADQAAHPMGAGRGFRLQAHGRAIHAVFKSNDPVIGFANAQDAANEGRSVAIPPRSHNPKSGFRSWSRPQCPLADHVASMPAVAGPMQPCTVRLEIVVPLPSKSRSARPVSPPGPRTCGLRCARRRSA